jgi:hypothetical protein
VKRQVTALLVNGKDTLLAGEVTLNAAVLYQIER